MIKTGEVVIGVIIGAITIGVIAWGWYLAFDYDQPEAPVDMPGIELDIDRAKPRPPLKQTQPKPAPPKPAAPAPKPGSK